MILVAKYVNKNYSYPSPPCRVCIVLAVLHPASYLFFSKHQMLSGHFANTPFGGGCTAVELSKAGRASW
jgi:hypothetical protein